MTFFSRWLCALRGHDAVLHFGPGRLSMQCHSCGWSSPGWNLHKPAKVLYMNLLVVRDKRRKVA